MQHFDRGERRFQTSRLKNNRKGYWNYNRGRTIGPLAMSPKELGRVVQNPAVCSCTMCSGTAMRRMYGNGHLGQRPGDLSALQLLCKEH